jgi:energy-coupling factor transporter ATP-binding protein EcfA2
MQDKVVINRIELRNFKAFNQFSITLAEMNILVGPNNSGKSTILNALRVLAAGLRRANAKVADMIEGPEGHTYGYIVPTDDLPVSLENVHTNYDDGIPTTVTFHLSNKSSLMLYFPPSGGARLIPIEPAKAVRTPSSFRNVFPIKVDFVPVLGPVEHEEPMVEARTVQRGLSTHRASRHFRNYWHQMPEGFDEFAEIIRNTWPGITISPPEVVDINKLAMFSKEERFDRELYWSGFGFQVWCQLMTHIVRSKEASLLVIDEPEIYLHPDLQRQLLLILRDAKSDILLATHSTEIVAEAEPSDIVVIDKTKRSGQRIKNLDQVQNAMNLLGSNQNITLTRLAKTRRVLFVEGQDFKIISRFAQQIDLKELANKINLTVVPVEGFSHWADVKSLAWGIEQTLGTSLSLFAVFDRDYRSDEEIESISNELKENLWMAHIHRRKEIENYLLVPSAIDKAIMRRLQDQSKRKGISLIEPNPVIEVLDKITNSIKINIQAQYTSSRMKFFRDRRSSLHESTIASETMGIFERKWQDINTRMEIVPGKEVLARLNTYLSETYGINLTPTAIIAEFRREDVPGDLLILLRNLDKFRRSQISN